MFEVAVLAMKTAETVYIAYHQRKIIPKKIIE